MSVSPVAVVLAAGKSTRMKSDVPKVLHEVLGRPMIEYVLDAARSAGVARIVVIVGHAGEQVQEALAGQPGVEIAWQREQLGTGHAVMMCREALRGHTGPTLVLMGDAPLMRGESLAALLHEARVQEAACVIGTAVTEANFGLGRIVRGASGEFLRIVEEKDATPAERRITEVNAGCYVFDGGRLFAALDQIRPNNQQGEYYLTDCAAELLKMGAKVVAVSRLNISEALGVNTRQQLAEVHRALQTAVFERLMSAGVTLVDPAQTSIDGRAQIGSDTVIAPFCAIQGPVTIGRRCRIGPHAVISGRAEIADGTVIPPFTHVQG